MDSLEVLMSFLVFVFVCALGLCGMCGGEFGVPAIACEAEPLGGHIEEFKVESP